MEIKLPESSIISDPHKIEESMKEAKKSFYELAKSKVRFLSHDQIQDWNKQYRDINKHVSPASYIMHYDTMTSDKKILAKWVNNLEIVVNKDAFTIDDKDFSDLIPFVLEHDIYEAWLHAKRGVNPKKKHLLSLRREFLLAAKQGLEDKLFEWHMFYNPDDEHRQECEHALDYAKRKEKI